ncbi:MAG: SRPBCC family protein [Myxococcota bacterium]
MAHAEFEHAIEMAVPPATLRTFLADLENYVPLHPLIESIRALPPRPDLPRAKHYRVVDRIPLGPFRLKAVYTAALDPISPTEVHGLAWQSPGVHLHTTYRIEPEPGGLLLREYVRVEAPWLLLRFVVGQASASHRTTLFEMKALLEARAEA